MHDEALDAETIQNLRDLAGDDTHFLSQMVELFLKGAAEKLPAITSSLTAGKLKDVAALCHQLKSSAGNLGALQLGKLFENLESEAHRADAAAAAQNAFSDQIRFPARGASASQTERLTLRRIAARARRTPSL